MPVMQDDHLIQTLPPDTADEPLDIRVLPRRAGGSHHFIDAHMAHTLPKMSAVDAVPVAEERAWRLVPRKRLDHLLGRPLGCWMLSDIEVYNASALVSQDDEDEEHPERHRRHHKALQGDHVLHIVLKKGFPRGGRGFLGSCTIFLDGRFRHLDAKLSEFADNPG